MEETAPIKELSFADPEIAKSVKEKIEQKNIALSKGQAQTLLRKSHGPYLLNIPLETLLRQATSACMKLQNRIKLKNTKSL